MHIPNVLIVDDSKTIRNALKKIIHSLVNGFFLISLTVIEKGNNNFYIISSDTLC